MPMMNQSFSLMRKHFLRYSLLLVIPLISPFVSASGFAPAFLESTARHSETKEVIYTESFSRSSQGNQLKVIFRGPNGEHYASKVLNFAESRLQPEMKIVNDKLQLNTEITVQDNKAFIKDSSHNNLKKVDEKQVELSDHIIIDVGLDYFIKQKWDVLISGQTIPVKYLMTNDGKVYGLNIKHIQCKTPLKVESTCFTAQLANPIYRAVMGSTFFEYDNATKMISRFKGVGQLFNENGGLEKVDITYHHQ